MKRLLVALTLLSSSTFAQVSDANLWTGLGAKMDITKDLSLSYETQTRFDNNMSRLRTYYNELGAKYGLIKGLDVSVKYRFARKLRDTYWDSENRFNVDVAYGYKIKPANIRLKARARYQVAFNRLGVVNDVIFPRIRHVGRFKVSAKYQNKDFKLITPFISGELFTALRPINPISGLDAWRLSAGVTFDLPKKFEVDLGYIFEREVSAVLQNAHIYFVQLNYEFPSLKDKKKGSGDKL